MKHKGVKLGVAAIVLSFIPLAISIVTNPGNLKISLPDFSNKTNWWSDLIIPGGLLFCLLLIGIGMFVTRKSNEL